MDTYFKGIDDDGKERVADLESGSKLDHSESHLNDHKCDLNVLKA